MAVLALVVTACANDSMKPGEMSGTMKSEPMKSDSMKKDSMTMQHDAMDKDDMHGKKKMKSKEGMMSDSKM